MKIISKGIFCSDKVVLSFSFLFLTMMFSGSVSLNAQRTIDVGKAGSDVKRPVIAASSQYTIPPSVHRIVFLGNSITYGGRYIVDVEAYLIAHYPKRSYEIINVGLSSETVSGLSEEGHAGGSFPRPDLHERLARVLEKTKPDLVFACYGMNDGIYLPLDNERFQKFKDGILWLHQQVSQTGAKIILLTPPVFDDVKGKQKGYGAVLDKYSEWMLQLRDSNKWDIADIHFPMLKVLNERRKADSTFYFAGDGVHPNDFGNWVIAQQILLFLGEKEVSDYQSINAALSAFPKGEEILRLVSQRQAFTKNSWLTYTGHLRPGVPVGLPIDTALVRANKIEVQIRALVK